MSPSILAVIPARYASTRFPGKPLVQILGKPMVQHVWERVQAVPQIERTLIATDDERIAQAVSAFGGEVCITASHHPSGTDRIWEVAQQHPEYSLILNVQGDEPFIEASSLQRAITGMMSNPVADIVTLVTPIRNIEEWKDPNIVKAVISDSGQALYFSRAPIPFVRDEENVLPTAFRHLGLYFYRRAALERFTSLPPSVLEQAEKLEQLRALEAGMKIFAVTVEKAPIGIDTPEDLARLERSLAV